jgi:alpha-methylacyl-CoA racemase
MIINYIALTGALGAMGRKADRPPSPPLNLVGDFGGGALYLAMGMCAALFEAQRSGHGQIIDAAMTDGAASACGHVLRLSRTWACGADQRDNNLLDGGAHFYDTYETKDGKHVSIGSIEPQFYALLLEKAGLSQDTAFHGQMDKSQWPDLSTKLAAVIREKTRDEWCALMEGSDVCFAPVLTLGEAPDHAHNKARETFVAVHGVVQPNVAPRFSRTPSKVQETLPEVGKHTAEVLAEWGVA